MKCLFLVGILQVFKLDFLKFRSLEILNIHPCKQDVMISKDSHYNRPVMGFPSRNLQGLEVEFKRQNEVADLSVFSHTE